MVDLPCFSATGPDLCSNPNSIVVEGKHIKTGSNLFELIFKGTVAIKISKKDQEQLNTEIKVLVLPFLSSLAEEGDLYTWISETGRLNEPLALSFFKQIISGCQAIHDQNWIHRDIKLENILVFSDFRVKLCDFGLATKANEKKESEKVKVVGSHNYIAPEIYEGKPYTTAVDVYAIGVSLFILLMGKPPLGTAQVTDWLFRRLCFRRYKEFWERHEEDGPVLSSQAKDLLIKLLHPDPEERITLDGIQKHPFYQGDILEKYQVQVEMRKRQYKRNNAFV